MFENIGSFFKKIMKNEPKELLVDSTSSKDAAKERLHIVLMQDRANVSADFLELMKEEIVDVIKKYIVVDESQIDVRLTNQENEDGTLGAPSLHANIPILNIRNDIKCEVLKENEKEVVSENIDNDRTQIISIVKDIDLENDTNTDTKEENEENSLVNNENSEIVLVEEKSEININKEDVDNTVKTNNIEENVTEEKSENDKDVQVEENKDNINNENNDENSKIMNQDEIKYSAAEDTKSNDIDDLLEEDDDEDDDDDDVTFDDLLKAAEEEERLQQLGNSEPENKSELKQENVKNEVKDTQRPKRKIKSKTTKAKKNKK